MAILLLMKIAKERRMEKSQVFWDTKQNVSGYMEGLKQKYAARGCFEKRKRVKRYLYLFYAHL